MPTDLLSKYHLARQLDVDPRTLGKALAAANIKPRFSAGGTQLYTPGQVPGIRRQMRPHVRAIL